MEGVYTTKRRRVTVNEGLLRANSDKIFAWAEKKRDAGKTARTRADVFANYFDLPLFNLLEDRPHRMSLRVMSLEHYIASLQALQKDLAELFGNKESL